MKPKINTNYLYTQLKKYYKMKCKDIELTNEINNLKTKIVKQAESMKAINDHWSTTKTTLINEINNIKRRMDTNKERIDQCKGEITNRKH